jgi:adenylate cyclase
MTEERATRKLSGILSADAVGYSRLMEEDEASTIRNLENSKRLMSKLIEQFKGRVVDAPGDNLLAEFGSVVDTAECAVKIQQELKIKNTELPDNRKMEFRIGVNLGDIVEEADRIYGDGVNIAARLEGLAEPGGICISGRVYDQVENKLDLVYEYIGKHAAKNIKKPLRVYQVRMEARSVAEFHKAFELPEKPSVAVLPFVNMSRDSDQEYFSDGITEDLITDLSKISGLFVIARNSVFTYKGKAVKVQEVVSRELGVRYVLEGSVRKSGERVRITAQLIDATTGGHLWAERYNRDLKDIFAVQDEVTQQIISALKVKVEKVEQERAFRKETANLSAFDYNLRGWWYYHRFTRDTNDKAREMFERAIELDPEFAIAYAGLGFTYYEEWANQWSQDSQTLEQAFELAKRTIALNDSLPEAHRVLGDVYLYKKQYEQAIAERKKAVALDPNNADGIAGLGEVMVYNGQIEDGIALIKKAIRLNPHHHIWYFWVLGLASVLAGRYDEAEEILERAVICNPDFLSTHVILAVIYVETGRLKEAHVEAEEIMRLSPDFSLKLLKEMIPVKDQEIIGWATGVLTKAGLK